MNTKKPNILWIITDEHRCDSLGCYGSRWCRSPNIDALAQNGVRFDNCVTQSPVCVPSRNSQILSRYAHSVGVMWNLFCPLPDETPLTWLFRDAGYQVVDFGKCDYSDQKRHPFPHYEFGPGYGASAATPFYLEEGYDHDEFEVVRTVLGMDPPQDRLIVGGKYPLPKEQNEPGLLATRCEKFFQEEINAPFFLRVSIIAPHTPVLASEPFYGMTDPDTIDIPMPSETMDARICRHDAELLRKQQGFTALSPDQVRRARSSYYDLCIEVDEAIGRILDALRNSGYAENTIVAFNADHGAMLGEYGLAQKRCFYEPVVRVPFIMSCPGVIPSSETVADPVELIDFMPTLLAMAGLDVPEGLHGRDLLPQIHGRVSDPDRPVFSEIDTAADRQLKTDHGSHRAMVRRGPWKLVYSLFDGGYGEDGMLFNLVDDPREMNNLFDSSECGEVVRELKELVERWQQVR